METALPESYRIDEINRLNGFFTLYAVPWALIGLIHIELKTRQLTGFLFAFAFLVNILLFVYFSIRLSRMEAEEEEISLAQMAELKAMHRFLNRIYVGVGLVAGLVLLVFIFVLRQPVLLTPLFLIITGFLFAAHRWVYQLQNERWIAPVFFLMALILILLGNQYINWYSWGGFSGATLVWYVCLERQRTVYTWLQKPLHGAQTQPADDQTEE